MKCVKTSHDVIKEKVRFVNFHFVFNECHDEFLSEFFCVDIFDRPIEWAFQNPYELNF